MKTENNKNTGHISRPPVFAKIEAQRSGFDFERRSSGVNELSAILPEANDTKLAPTL